MKKNNSKKRPGLVDEWNAYMVQNAKFTDNDIPFCPTTATKIPKSIITYEEAKSIYRDNIRKKNYEFYIKDIFVCFYIDDRKFDSIYGIWTRPDMAVKILVHFGGVITPDFSTYADFPYPIKIYNTYRMRAFGYYLTTLGLKVINNVRWGTDETYSYCFDGVPKNSIICIGTVASGIRKLVNRPDFEKGFKKVVEILKPKVILLYGSSKLDLFNKPYLKNIRIISFQGRTNNYFKKKKKK